MTGIDASAVSAVLVTRPGNPVAVDHGIDRIRRVLQEVGFGQILLWRNGEYLVADHPGEPRWRLEDVADVGVYGRYEAAARAKLAAVYVQDDDALLPPESIAALLARYDPGKLTVNMPERFRRWYTDSALVGFGAVFNRDLPAAAFHRWREHWSRQHCEAEYRLLERRPDVVFTTLTPQAPWLDLPYEELPYATGPDRAYRQRNHAKERAHVLALARQVRDARRVG